MASAENNTSGPVPHVQKTFDRSRSSLSLHGYDVFVTRSSARSSSNDVDPQLFRRAPHDIDMSVENVSSGLVRKDKKDVKIMTISDPSNKTTACPDLEMCMLASRYSIVENPKTLRSNG
ncbi:hypothetical protein Tco_1122192 [Tanacetum coccineum]|uniref:Uncharacterized protein n=1 Tax=Tanacetum coccineum TaxID=301880 RepID=A0ABQ5J262_9ASTR